MTGSGVGPALSDTLSWAASIDCTTSCVSRPTRDNRRFRLPSEVSHRESTPHLPPFAPFPSPSRRKKSDQPAKDRPAAAKSHPMAGLRLRASAPPSCPDASSASRSIRRSLALLRRGRFGRGVEDDQCRHHLDAGFRRRRLLLDRLRRLDPKNPNVVWVGTGENNSQRSVGYGDGVYKSIDGGQSWRTSGLKTSEHIGKIVDRPARLGHVYVAAQGPLWEPGGDGASTRRPTAARPGRRF